MTISNLGILLTHPCHSQLSKEIKTGTQFKKLEAGTDAKAGEEYLLLSPHDLLSLASHRALDQQPMGSSAHSGLDPPI